VNLYVFITEESTTEFLNQKKTKKDRQEGEMQIQGELNMVKLLIMTGLQKGQAKSAISLADGGTRKPKKPRGNSKARGPGIVTSHRTDGGRSRAGDKGRGTLVQRPGGQRTVG